MVKGTPKCFVHASYMLRTKGVSENEISEGLESNVKVFPADPVKTSVPIRIENTKPKASSGLYSTLPLVLAANKAAGSSSTVKSSSTSKPQAPN